MILFCGDGWMVFGQGSKDGTEGFYHMGIRICDQWCDCDEPVYSSSWDTDSGIVSKAKDLPECIKLIYEQQTTKTRQSDMSHDKIEECIFKDLKSKGKLDPPSSAEHKAMCEGDMTLSTALFTGLS